MKSRLKVEPKVTKPFSPIIKPETESKSIKHYRDEYSKVLKEKMAIEKDISTKIESENKRFEEENQLLRDKLKAERQEKEKIQAKLTDLTERYETILEENNSLNVELNRAKVTIDNLELELENERENIKLLEDRVDSLGSVRATENGAKIETILLEELSKKMDYLSSTIEELKFKAVPRKEEKREPIKIRNMFKSTYSPNESNSIAEQPKSSRSEDSEFDEVFKYEGKYDNLKSLNKYFKFKKFAYQSETLKSA